jgi:hypothetical protein
MRALARERLIAKPRDPWHGIARSAASSGGLT